MTDLNQQIKAALSDKNLPADEYRALQQQAQKECFEATARRDALRPKGVRDPMLGGTAGPERQKALATGTDKELAALQQEYETCCLKVQRLEAQTAQLGDMYQTTRARQAVEGLPDEYGKLREAIGAVVQADQALAAAWAACDAQYQVVSESRRWGIKHAKQLPKADEALLEAVARARRCAATGTPRLHIVRGGVVEDALGIDDSRQVIAFAS